MRLKADIEKAIVAWKGIKETIDSTPTVEATVRHGIAQGIIQALEWTLGKDDTMFGPVTVKRKRREGVGRPFIGINDSRLVELRRKGKSLQWLAKEFRCAKATVVAHLKRAELQAISDIDNFADSDD